MPNAISHESRRNMGLSIPAAGTLGLVALLLGFHLFVFLSSCCGIPMYRDVANRWHGLNLNVMLSSAFALLVGGITSWLLSWFAGSSSRINNGLVLLGVAFAVGFIEVYGAIVLGIETPHELPFLTDFFLLFLGSVAIGVTALLVQGKAKLSGWARVVLAWTGGVWLSAALLLLGMMSQPF